MFTIANSIAVSMYIIGFCDSLIDMVEGEVTPILDSNGEVLPYSMMGHGRLNDIRVIGEAGVAGSSIKI